MAKKTTLAKITEASENLSKVQAELSTFSDIRKLTDNEQILAKFDAFEKRAKEDVVYLENRIRGFIARDAKIADLIAVAPKLFS